MINFIIVIVDILNLDKVVFIYDINYVEVMFLDFLFEFYFMC